MDFNLFDLIILAIVLLLGLKGVLNGFFKELFGLVGIIGGIYVASRSAEYFGNIINNALFHFDSTTTVTFTGFLVTFAAFWTAMVMLGILFKKLTHISGLGVVDKLFGFFIGSSKFFLIFSVILFAAYSIKSFRAIIEPQFENSLIAPIMVETGSIIMHLQPLDLDTTLQENVDKASSEAEKKLQEEMQKKAASLMKNVDKKLEINGTKQ